MAGATASDHFRDGQTLDALTENNMFPGYATTSIMSVELLQKSAQAAAFLQEHYPPVFNWDDPIGTCAWYLSNGFMAMMLRDDGSIAALASARPVDKPGDGAVPYRYNDKGECIFVDLLVSENVPLAIKGFSFIMRKRFGNRKKVAFFRAPKEVLRVHDFDVCVRNLERKRKEYEPVK